MQHNKKGRKLGRRPDHRKAMMRNLALSLIAEERIETTVPRAKELRRFAERLVTYAKRGDLHGRRLIIQRLGGFPTAPAAAEKLLEDIAPRYSERAGGYTRVLKTGSRRGDAAPLALIEWVEEELPERKKKKKPATKSTATAQPAEAEVDSDEVANDEAAETAEQETAVAEQAEDASPDAGEASGDATSDESAEVVADESESPTAEAEPEGDDAEAASEVTEENSSDSDSSEPDPSGDPDAGDEDADKS